MIWRAWTGFLVKPWPIAVVLYIYNSLALPFYDSRFIYTYRVFSCTSIVDMYIYICVLWIFLYINFYNHTMYFIFSL